MKRETEKGIKMQYLYEETKNGIRLNRVWGYDDIVELPDMLNGKEVTELGAYVFSDQMDKRELEQMIKGGNLWTEEGNRKSDVEKLPEAAGPALRELILPKGMKKVGRYAFYNCRNLKKLYFGGKLKDLGAGALTGCHKVQELRVRLEEDGESCLREILTELPETLCVTIEKNKEKGHFWFPEFFEEGVENTPARILENHVHGSGIRYRNCFQNRKLNTAEYDALFPYAIAWEDEETVLKLALGRILTPFELAKKSEEHYLTYLREHMDRAAEILGEQKEYRLLGILLDILKPESKEIDKMLETARLQKDSIWIGLLMDRLGKTGRSKRRTFEL